MENKIMNEFKNTIQIGAWVPATGSEEEIKEMSEAGIEFIFAGRGDDEKLKNMLTWCEKYSVKCIIHDSRLYGNVNNENLSKETISEYIQRYIENPYVLGNSLYDEPNMKIYKNLSDVGKKYYKASSGKIPFVNLLPIYANAEQLGIDSYKKYVEEYINNFDTDYICVDVYPLTNGNTTLPSYLENLDIMGTTARESCRDFWIFIQSMPFNNMRAPSEEDMRFQVYSCLSFGAKNILHFCYATPASGAETFPYGMIDLNGKKTHLWYTAQKINKELKKLSPTYVKYKSLGAYSFKAGKIPDYLNFGNEYNNFDLIDNLKSDQSLLIGCFEAKEGNGKAFTLVNMSELKDKLTANISFSLKNGVKTVAYIKGDQSELKNVSGKYNISLESGEGIFITVE
ncbi:MAG: hypothetical protein K0S55_1257 [Clostridia bacterium]|nr:hypothetical protein [Clostridia bacterium]